MSNDAVSRRDLLALAAAASIAAESPLMAGAANAAGAAPAAGGGRVLVDRGFARLQEGLVHYRSACRERLGKRSAPLPLYFAHTGPGSGRTHEPMLEAFGTTRFAFAPDMLGNGDSSPPAREDLEIGDYVDAAIRFADSLGLERFDFYGSHTGAQIGAQLAVEHPQARARRRAAILARSEAAAAGALRTGDRAGRFRHAPDLGLEFRPRPAAVFPVVRPQQRAPAVESGAARGPDQRQRRE